MRLFAAAAFALTIGAAGLAQAAKQDFTLVNRTGYTVAHVYVSAADSNSWEEDVLGEDTLENGDHVDIAFEKGERGCLYDLKVVYDDGDSSAWGRSTCARSAGSRSTGTARPGPPAPSPNRRAGAGAALRPLRQPECCMHERRGQGGIRMPPWPMSIFRSSRSDIL